MPYAQFVLPSSYTTSHGNYSEYAHEVFNSITLIDPTAKLCALYSRSGLALSASQIAAKYPDRPTETLVVKWEDLP
jgi:hypothetical protein